MTLTEWERSIVEHKAFQRLRRIRQLAWTDIVYPGAMHTRFEHSLGVMHVATRMFDEIWNRRETELLALGFNRHAKERDRQLLRILALLHDVGHSPFSHAGEDLMPKKEDGSRYKHEAYSSAIIRSMTDVIDNHPHNRRGFNITAAEVADVLDEKPDIGFTKLFWRQLMSSQLDADRADYLLRDSHHLGVQYGHYDLNRLLISLTVAQDPETEDPLLAVEYGGWHTAEALIIARYMMFSQVYYHKTRAIFDLHVTEAVKSILAEEQARTSYAEKDKFPPPASEHLEAYSSWDDWRVLGLLHSGKGGEHGEILRDRRHYRMVYESGGPDAATLPNDERERFVQIEQRFDAAKAALGALVAHAPAPRNTWYKPEVEIMVALGEDGNPKKRVFPLSNVSTVVRALKRERLFRLYVRDSDKTTAEEILKNLPLTT